MQATKDLKMTYCGWPFNNQGESYPQNTNGTIIIIVQTSIPSNQECKHFQIFDISRPKGTKLIFTTSVHKHCGTLKSYMRTITQNEQVCFCSGPTKHGCLGNYLKSAHIIVQVWSCKEKQPKVKGRLQSAHKREWLLLSIPCDIQSD